ILNSSRQVAGEHVLDTAAGNPAHMRIGKTRAEGGAGEGVVGRVIDVRPGNAGGPIDERAVVVDGDAGAAAQRRDAVEAVRTLEGGMGEGVTAMEPGAGQIRFRPDQELPPLDVVADLAAEKPAGSALVGGNAGRSGKLPIDIRPAVADMSPDIKTGPGECRAVRDGLVVDGTARRAAKIGRGGGMAHHA